MCRAKRKRTTSAAGGCTCIAKLLGIVGAPRSTDGADPIGFDPWNIGFEPLNPANKCWKKGNPTPREPVPIQPGGRAVGVIVFPIAIVFNV